MFTLTAEESDQLFNLVEKYKTKNCNYSEGMNVEYETTPCVCTDMNDYCRCTEIFNIQINAGLLFFYEILKDSPIKKDPLVHLLTSKYLFKNSLFSGEAEGGYYGQEMGPVTWDNPEILYDYIQNTNGSIPEMIKQNLLAEYDNLLADNAKDYLEAGCDWKLIQIPFDKIIHSGNNHKQFDYHTNSKSNWFGHELEILVNEYLSHYSYYGNKQKVHIEKRFNNFNKLVELYSLYCVPESNGFYKIIDGNHKFSGLKKVYNMKILPQSTRNKEVKKVYDKKTLEIKTLLSEKKVLAFVPIIL